MPILQIINKFTQMLKRFCATLVMILSFLLQSAICQVNAPIIRTKVVQGSSVDNIRLFSTQNIRTVDAFSENMSGEGFNVDNDNSGYFNLRYQADADFEGIDLAIFETQESLFGPPTFVTVEIEVVRSIVEAHDDFGMIDPQEVLTIEVLANDESSSESIEIIEIEASTGGVFTIEDGTRLLFTPDSSFVGLASASYIVGDGLGTTSMANAFVQVIGSEVNPETINYLHVVSDPLLIILEGNGYSLSPESNLLFGELNQLAPFAFEYNSELFVDGIESFTLVDDQGNIKNIEISLVKTVDNNSVLVDDQAYVVPGEFTVIDAVSNDFRNNGVIIDHSDELLYVSGVFIYEADDDFEGVKELFYTVHDGFQSHTASIDVFVGNYKPAVTEYAFQTYSGLPLALEYNVPITAFTFSMLTEPASGTLETGASAVDGDCSSAVGSNMVVYTPNAGFIGEDDFSLEYCSEAGVCETVNVRVNVIESTDNCPCLGPNCVWAGDTNRDGVVNIADLLPIGLNYGASGASREKTGVNWAAQYSEDWVQVQLDGSNVNHVDANGDGLVSINDTSAILANYGNQDNFIPDATVLDKAIPIRFEVVNTNVSNGDQVQIDLHVGSDDFPAIDLHGLALSLSLPPSLVSDSTTLEFVPDNQWLGSNSPIVPLSFIRGNNADIGVTRIDNVGISGTGKIGTLNTTVVIDIDQLRPNGPEIPLKFKAPKSIMVDGRGVPIQVKGAEIELMLQLDSDVQISDDLIEEVEVIISPNPSTGPISIHANNNDQLREVAIYDMIGQLQYERDNLTSNHLNVDQTFNQGLYFAHIKTIKGTTVQQIEVIK